MEIKSLLSLPKEKRSRANAKELLKALEEAEEQLGIMVRSPFYDTYITLQAQVADWNKQLKIAENPETITISENGIDIQKSVLKGKIDLFADKDSKEFDRVFKYFSEVITILEALDKIRAKLTPQELRQAESTSEIDDVRSSIKNGRK